MSDSQGRRKVMILTTIGKSGVVVETSADNWADLKRDMSRQGVVVDNMNAVEGSSRMSFENDEAALPTGDFKVFMSPKETKSGTDSEDRVQHLLEKYGDKANKHFNAGMHYTDKSDKALVALLDSWKEMRRREKEERVEGVVKSAPENVDYSAKAIATRLRAIREQLDEALELADIASEAEDVTAKPFAKGPSYSSSESSSYDDDDDYGYSGDDEDED
jgi:hypothetical protein